MCLWDWTHIMLISVPGDNDTSDNRPILLWTKPVNESTNAFYCPLFLRTSSHLLLISVIMGETCFLKRSVSLENPYVDISSWRSYRDFSLWSSLTNHLVREYIHYQVLSQSHLQMHWFFEAGYSLSQGKPRTSTDTGASFDVVQATLTH